MSIITANERQVGGDHYRTPAGALQHWDVVHDADVPYLLAVASKYVARHHLKDGRQDLEKAIHYQEKWLEKVGPNTLTRSWAVSSVELLGWCAAAELSAPEVRVLYAMLGWRRIDESLRLTRELLEKRYPAKVDIPGDPLDGAIIGSRLRIQMPPEYVSSDGPGLSEAEPDWTHPVHQRPGTPEDGGHHARQACEPEPETETEEIRHYDAVDVLAGNLPSILSRHEYLHHCEKVVQDRYQWNNSAASWILTEPVTN